jgi:hypothetical protein
MCSQHFLLNSTLFQYINFGNNLKAQVVHPDKGPYIPASTKLQGLKCNLHVIYLSAKVESQYCQTIFLVQSHDKIQTHLKFYNSIAVSQPQLKCVKINVKCTICNTNVPLFIRTKKPFDCCITCFLIGHRQSNSDLKAIVFLSFWPPSN